MDEKYQDVENHELDEQIRNCNEILSEEELSKCLNRLREIPDQDFGPNNFVELERKQMESEFPELFQTVAGVPHDPKELSSVAKMIEEIDVRINRNDNWTVIDHPIDHSANGKQIKEQWLAIDEQQIIDKCAKMWQNHEDVMLETMPNDLKDEITKDLKGLLVFYIDVGPLPPFKAERFIERIKIEFAHIKLRIPLEYEIMFLSVKNENTRIELIRF